MTAERRRHARTTINLPLTVMMEGRPFPGDLVDISRGGLMVHCPFAVELAARVRVEMKILPATGCSGEGQVVRVAGDRGFGVHFTECNPEMFEFINDVSSLSEELRNDFLRAVVEPKMEIDPVAA